MRVNRLSVLVLAALIAMLLPVSVKALTTISQSYLSNDESSLGSIVSLRKDSTDFVNNALPKNVENLLGVVIGADNSLISISSDQASRVQVATSGIVGVLVSDINGDIYAGDPITASPISGVGMKATANSKVVGVAQENLNNRTATKQKYKDKNGKEQEVVIGQVPTLVNVTYYYKQPEKTIIPAAIQNIANAFAGKRVNTLPIIISLAIFLLTIIIVVSIIYAMIHSSIISVGRNPMSQSAIYHNLVQLSALVVAILAVSLISIYQVLSKF